MSKKINFTVKEYIGTQILDISAKNDKCSFEELCEKYQFKNFDDLYNGKIILAPHPGGGFIKAIVIENKSEDYNESNKNTNKFCFTNEAETYVGILEFAQDERKCWICGGLINTKAIKSLRMQK